MVNNTNRDSSSNFPTNGEYSFKGDHLQITAIYFFKGRQAGIHQSKIVVLGFFINVVHGHSYAIRTFMQIIQVGDATTSKKYDSDTKPKCFCDPHTICDFIFLNLRILG